MTPKLEVERLTYAKILNRNNLKHNNMKHLRHLLWLWLAVMLLAVPFNANATDYFKSEYNSMCFIVTPNGQGCVHIKVLHLDQMTGDNGYIKKNDDFPEGAWLYVEMPNASRRYLVSIYNKNDRSDDNDDYIDVYMRFSQKGENGYTNNGTLFLTNPTSGGPVKMDHSNHSYRVKKPKGDARCYVEFDWYYPSELAGKELRFYLNGPVGAGADLNNRELSGSPFTTSTKPDLTLSPPVFTPTGANMGYYSLIASNNTGVELQVDSVKEIVSTTGGGNIDISDQCKSSSDGFSLLIKAVDYTRQVLIASKVPYSAYEYFPLPMQTVELKSFHNPKNFSFTSSWGKKGATVLKWTVPYADDEDAITTDLFAIERQLYDSEKADSVDVWETIDQIPIERGKANYEYVDSTLGCYGNAQFNSVRYRLYRLTVGKNDAYTVYTEMPKKRDGVMLGFLEPVKAQLTDRGTVLLNWMPINFTNDGVRRFQPDGWRLFLERHSYYYKGGMPVETVTEKDITDSFYTSKDNYTDRGLPEYPDYWIYYSEYEDEDFAPCTEYSYALVLYPNDPAGVMPRMEEWFVEKNDTVRIEPIRDDSKIGNFTASDNTLQDRIHLQWSLDMDRIETIKLEKVAGRGIQVLPIDPQLRYYDDFDVEAGGYYEYMLTVTYECKDGMHTLSPDPIEGRRRATGKIGGFVTFQDGTGLSNVEVQLLSKDDKVLETCLTDAKGAYIFPDVPYKDDYYTVSINSTITGFDRRQISVYVNRSKPFNYDMNFVSDGSFDVDGYVYFEQTTVPVYGATFKVDGLTVIDKSGHPVISDNDGHFAFKVRKGAKRLEVEKEGHTFMMDGLYADNHGNAIEITEPRINITFWDQTKVRTIGRVVGGLDQGEKPLGFGLSKNNMGDDLRIVLELEGNQRSWLVKDQQDDVLTTRYDTLTFEAASDKPTSTVITERHRVVISPNCATGEYMVDLLPARYKVVEVSAKGYPSLFQKGKVSEVLDLTDSLTTKSIANNGKTVEYKAIYNRIFRIEPSVTITEVDTKTGASLPNVGLVTYTESADDATPINVPIYDVTKQTYTFGYPVLNVGRHNFRIAATENYYYNGLQTGRCDSVPLRGGSVQVYDDFAALQHDTLCVLNEHTGETVICVDVQNTVYDVQGTNALRHLDVTLEHDGQFIDGKSLRAFVMGFQKIVDDVVSADGMIELVDVLRDPPGSKSYAWVDKETHYQSQFVFNFGGDLALQIGMEMGSKSDLVSGTYAGSPAAGAFIGMQTAAKTVWAINPVNIPLIGYHYTYNGTVDFQLNERIQTSNDPAFVGDNGDVYIGYELVAASSFIRNIRAINAFTYDYLKGQNFFNEKDGVCHLIAEGKDVDGQPYYLISDYNYQVGPKVKSNFAYTQDYIVNTLLPKLRAARNSYLYKGTREQAQAHANATLRNVCFSLRDEDDPRYGQDNRDDSLEYISIDRYGELYDKLNYEIITPSYVKALGLEKQLKEEASATDSVRIMNRQIAQWEYIVMLNEEEKVTAFATIDNNRKKRGDMSYDPGSPYNVKESYYAENHSVSGGISFSHSESFAHQEKTDHQVPVFGFDFTDWSAKQGMQYFNKVINGAFSIAESGANSRSKTWGTSSKPKDQNVEINYRVLNDDGSNAYSGKQTVSGDDLKSINRLADAMKFIPKGAQDISVSAVSTYTKVLIAPQIDLTYESNNNESTTSTVYRGYELATDADSHLDVDVYHDVATVTTSTTIVGTSSSQRTLSEGNYIFRTMGGATKCPHEAGSVTKYYAKGTQLSAPTAYVERPRITVENHIVSNVPYGETAKFNLVLSNEGTVREEGSFDLVLLDKTNQAGASLVMDGAPLGSGRSLVVPFGTGMLKVLEVGQGSVDDYENIRLALRSQCDPSVADTVSLSVHFVPSASPIAVITPQDKWVLNTNSAQDERGRYYMPVSIGGYDVNFRNFDHIELQYKQSREPESRWTNLCSYYSVDSLYQKGVGTKAMLTGGTLTHAFYGDSDPVELNYDLRAVTYSRLGNGFVTTISPVFSGIKDTRRPTLFGSPLPANGILGVGDDMKLVFNENIDANRLLAANNFKVTGLPNSSEIGTSTSLVFKGSSVLSSEVERNLGDEDFSIDMMVKPTSEEAGMTLFSHHTRSGDAMEFAIDGKDGALTTTFYSAATGKTTTFRSKTDASLNWNMFQRVVMVYDSKLRQVHFYVNGANMDSEADKDKTLSRDYKGSGKMFFGTGFTGNMLETRVWGKALTLIDLAKTDRKKLYGYEVGLCAYYPMDEGFGNTVEDKAQGATLTLHNVAWEMPEGRALKLTDDIRQGKVLLKADQLAPMSDSGQDYTLSFWFNADVVNADTFTLLSDALANGNDMTIKDGKLVLRYGDSNILQGNGIFNDGLWHHAALSVSHTMNQAFLYVDGEVVDQVAASLMSPWHNRICLGAKYTDGKYIQGMNGYLDELMLWNMFLPQNVLKQWMNESLDGTEPGLLAYVPFSNQVMQASGGGTLMEFSPLAYANKWDTELQKAVRTSDEIFIGTDAQLKAMESVQVYAPIKEKTKVRNLRFDFITKDNELIIALQEPAKDIDRTTVNITAMGIEDLNGNEMAQPVTWSAFIDRNMLRWTEEKKRVDIDAEQYEDKVFTVAIKNYGGARRSYTIEGLPSWMTIEEGLQGRLEPEETMEFHIVVSKDINIDTYDEVLYLKNDEGLVSPLPLTIRKSGAVPTWTFNKSSQRNMQVVAQVKKGSLVVTDKQDLVGAFDEYDKCLGTAQVETDQTGKSLFYITVYGERSNAGVFFRLWDASSGIIYSLTPDQDITYKPDAIVGSYDAPVVMVASPSIARTLELSPTWTWVSLNVASPKAGDINQLMKSGSWTNGDQLKDPEQQTFYNYDRGTWRYSLSGVTDSLRCDRMYYIKSQKVQVIPLEGRPITEKKERTMVLHADWNYIGYTPMVNLPVNEALSDFYSKASDGDIIKSQDEFATFSAAAGAWRGNLHYMKPGKGYMLYHKVTEQRPDSSITFSYPFKSTVAVTNADAPQRVVVDEDAEPLWTNTRLTSMNMIVRAEGVDAEEGDRIYAYADGELCGIAEATDVDGEQLFFLSVGAEKQTRMTFTLERDGELLGAATRSGVLYQADTLEGTTDMPKVIDFSDAITYETGVWYTLTGIRLGEHKPAVPGVYIFNGQRVTIQ